VVTECESSRGGEKIIFQFFIFQHYPLTMSRDTRETETQTLPEISHNKAHTSERDSAREIRIRKRVEAILYARPKSDPDRRELRRLNDELNELSKVTTRDADYHAKVARLTDRHLFLAQEWDEAVREFETRV
jgi:hypothetical protein